MNVNNLTGPAAIGNKGLVSRPQFDMNIFEKGVAINVVAIEANGTNLYYGFSENCLITRATPLTIEVGYCDGDGDIQTVEIHVGDLVENYVTITILK